ncbi:hypothetical protein QFC21_002157 [Naganishia friedmannii]|uniref:Uncharacterized protein n=1 Tax=Naganishia friedmannii TaxID=89922 RepID=A0ACC2W021_9TREE|nr:hypothetical protein QFC21_002157 [Naganishia friedmannii]
MPAQTLPSNTKKTATTTAATAAKKRPAQQDTSMHPSKKQRLDVPSKTGAKGGAAATSLNNAGARKPGGAEVAVAVAGNGAGARKTGGAAAGGGGGGKKGKEGLIPTAPSGDKQVAVGSMEKVGEASIGKVVEGASTEKMAVLTEKTKTNSEADDRAMNTVANDAAPPQEIKDNQAVPPKPAATMAVVTAPTTTKSKSKAQFKSNPTKNTETNTISTPKKLITSRRMPPPKPLPTTTSFTTINDGQSLLGRPKGASGSGPTRDVTGRNVVFVTRKTGLGSYMRRCKALLVDEGMNEITLHALCVAIPHAVMLLYALVDILPYPRQFVHHEIRTESVDCVDEMVGVEPVVGGKAKGKGKGKAEEGKVFSIFEEDEGGLRSRTKSGIRITIRIGKGARVSAAEHAAPSTSATTGDGGEKKRKARPNNAQRVAKRSAGESDLVEQTGGKGNLLQKRTRQEEEESMNEVGGPALPPAAAPAAPKNVAADTGETKSVAAGKKQTRGSSKRKTKAGKVAGGASAMDVD